MATQTRPLPPDGSAESPGFQPFVPPSQSPAELTLRALILGAILGIVFAASSVYLALKIGLTVSASIPIAVLAAAAQAAVPQARVRPAPRSLSGRKRFQSPRSFAFALSSSMTGGICHRVGAASSWSLKTFSAG